MLTLPVAVAEFHIIVGGEQSNQFDWCSEYTLENCHGTWKSPIWKGKSSFKPSLLLVFHVNFQGCNYDFYALLLHHRKSFVFRFLQKLIGTNYSVALPNADFALNCTQQEVRVCVFFLLWPEILRTVTADKNRKNKTIHVSFFPKLMVA